MSYEVETYVQLEQIIRTITPPKKIKSSEYLKSGKYPIMDQSPGEIAGWTDEDSALVHPPTEGLIVFGDHTCVLKFTTEPFAQGADGIKIFRLDESVNGYYIFAHLKAFPLINDGYKRHFSDLKRLKIKIPEKRIQEYISELAVLIDSKIRVNIALCKSLEAIAQYIFKSWFIDFDPVHAKSRGEKPFGMDDETAALFPDSFEESELGMIPKGWSVGKFGNFNNLIMGQSPPGESYNNEGLGLPFYQGRTDFGTRFPERRIYCTIEKRVANSSETLVSVRAPVGDINQAIEKCVIGRGIAAVMHKSNSSIYTYSLISSLKSQLAYFNGEGSVFGAINKTDFENLRILEPSNALIKKFDQLLDPTNLLIHELHHSSKNLISLRDSLLPKLISGELKIPEELLVS